MPTSKELRETRAVVNEEIQAMSDLASDAEHKWSDEDEQKWTRVNEDYDAQTKSIERQERAEFTAAKESEPNAHVVPGRDDYDGRDAQQATDEKLSGGGKGRHSQDEDRAVALQAWLRAGNEETPLEQHHIEACQRVGRNPNSVGYEFSYLPTQNLRAMQAAFINGRPEGASARALSVVQGSAGAFLTAPEELVSSLEIALLEFGGMRQVSEIIRSAQGNPLVWPTSDDTSNTGVQIGENTTVSEDDPTFKQKVWYDYKFSSNMIKVPVEALEDSAFPLPPLLGRMLGERLGRIGNTKFTTGLGSATPEGIIVGSTLGKTTASSTAITWDEVLDLVHSVDPAYRNGAGFMFHDNVLLALRKLKDGEARPLWQSNIQVGAPDTIYNHGFTVNQDMSSAITSSKITIEFGQLSNYKIRDIGSIRMIRLNERFADTDQVAFLAFQRMDGKLLDAGTHPVKHMVQT